MRRPVREFLLACLSCCALWDVRAADHVDITWMSITNLHLDFGSMGIVADGYITRLPQDLFHGGGGGLAATRAAMHPDEAAVREVFEAIGGRRAVDLLITGHSHFDHSFDTPVWARLARAPIVGSATTCLQARAAGLPAGRCRAVVGGEHVRIGNGIDMYVVRWNHSGDSARNPEQHDPRELTAAPVRAANGGWRAGVAEDFPNGGGGRAYLFVVQAPRGPLSLFFQDSAGAGDLAAPVVVDGRDFGAPLANLRVALRQAGLERVDLWIGTGGTEVAELVLPVLKPAAYLPVHWDGLFGAFKDGPPGPFADPQLEALLAGAGVVLIRPVQYMDKWRLDRDGVHAVDNQAVQSRLGFR